MHEAGTKSARGVQNLEEEIRRRAYELYEQRGREGGHEVEDWLRAEEEVTHGSRRRTAA